VRFLDNIENGSTNIKRMGIIKAIFVMVLSILLETLGQMPVEFLNLFSGRFEKVVPYVVFVFGVLVKYYVIIILFKWLSNKSDEQKYKYYLNRKDYVYAALIIIAFRLIFDNSVIFWVENIPMPNFINASFSELSVSPIILILSVTVVSPIYEEIIFRVVLLAGMSKNMNQGIALVASALFFALVHMNVPQGINAFFLGLALGYIYLRTGSIYLSIFAHFVNNFLALSISSIFSLIGGKYAIEIHGLFLIVGIILLAIVYDGYIPNKTNIKPKIYKKYMEM